MDPEELDAALDDLRRDRDRQRQDFDRLRREYDDLRTKLRYPGTAFLVELEYKLVYEGTIEVATVDIEVDDIFETLPGAIHAVYVLSAYCTDSNTPVVVCDGSLSVAPSNAVAVAIQRQRQTSPTRIEASVVVRNDTAGTVNVAVRVWRRLGMGS
jgi:hypothetical protein